MRYTYPTLCLRASGGFYMEPCAVAVVIPGSLQMRKSTQTTQEAACVSFGLDASSWSRHFQLLLDRQAGLASDLLWPFQAAFVPLVCFHVAGSQSRHTMLLLMPRENQLLLYPRPWEELTSRTSNLKAYTAKGTLSEPSWVIYWLDPPRAPGCYLHQLPKVWDDLGCRDKGYMQQC